jgi:hypothetical protein
MRTNFVGRSAVSAMTQTPASGPFGPVTTPPMSSASMGTLGGGDWRAPVMETARMTRHPIANRPAFALRNVFMVGLLLACRMVLDS